MNYRNPRMMRARARYPRGYAAQGGLVDDLLGRGKSYVDKALPVLEVAKNVLQDPALPEVTRLMLKLHAMEQPKPKAGQAAPTVPATVKGIGLNKAVAPLQFYVNVRENPIIGYAVVAGILAVPFMAGYVVGRKRR